MDNTYMYYSPAEIEYRRQRAAKSVKRRRRRTARAPWHRRHASEETT